MTIEHSTVRTESYSDSGFGKGYDYPPPLPERFMSAVGAVAKRVAQRLLRAAFGTIGQLLEIRHWGEPRPSLRSAAFQPQRILVVRTDLLGDVVLTLPAVHALRLAYPHAHIDMVVLPSTAGILRDQPDINGIVTCDPATWITGLLNPEQRQSILATIHQMRKAQYDLAVSICGDWGSIITRLSGARRRVGYANEAYAHFLTDPVPGKRYQFRQHERLYGLALAQHAGGILENNDEEKDTTRPKLLVSDATRQQIVSLLQEFGISPEQRVIALHAGSRNGQAKRWPLPYWARLAEQLIDQIPGCAVVLIGAAGDKALAQGVIQRMRGQGKAYDLTGTTNLPALAGLLAHCQVVITGDSGPLHIAEAVGTAVVAIHGPTDPILSGPSSKNAIILRRDIWCSPCYDSSATAECRFYNPLCMKGIVPADVLAATLKQMGIPTEG